VDGWSSCHHPSRFFHFALAEVSSHCAPSLDRKHSRVSQAVSGGTRVPGDTANLNEERHPRQGPLHWGQGMVYWAGTLQIHCRDMDKVPIIYQLGHWKYIHNFPS